MKQPRYTYNLLLLLGLLLVVASCAKQGYPSGGPKDSEPPKVLAATFLPPKEMRLAFDEYVVIKDADNNVLISPPLAKKPTFTTQGRSVVVKFNDSLQTNTTYLFQFLEAIADLNEGNLLSSYSVAFTTGDTLDSAQLYGRVLDALTAQPREERVSLYLYHADIPDSVLANGIPLYCTWCDKNGYFHFTNIKPGQYRIFAIEDADRDYHLGASEAVGFLTTTVTAVDSVIDTISIAISSVSEQKQRLASADFKKKGRISITSVLPMQQPEFEPKDIGVWALNSTRDTLTLWTTNEADSAHFVFSDPSGVHDTLTLKYRPSKSKISSAVVGDKKLLSSSIAATHPYFDTLWLRFQNPINTSLSQSDSLVRIYCLTDSTTTYVPVSFCDDGLQAVTKAWIPFNGAQSYGYKIFIRDSAFTDIYGAKSDSLLVTTQFTKAENYGNIRLSVALDSAESFTAWMIQLLDGKGNVVKEQAIDARQQVVSFSNLSPGKYTIRAFADLNRNGNWDGANFWQHREAEPVVHFPKTLDVRGNWDFEESFILKQ